MSPPLGSIDRKKTLVHRFENRLKIERLFVRRHGTCAGDTGKKGNSNCEGTNCRLHCLHSIRFDLPDQGLGGTLPAFVRVFRTLEPRNAVRGERVAIRRLKKM